MMDGTGGYLLTGIKVDHLYKDSTDNPGVHTNPTVNTPVNPLLNPSNPLLNPSNPDSCAQKELDVKPDISHIDPYRDVDGNTTTLMDNPDGDSAEPPSKRTKSS